MLINQRILINGEPFTPSLLGRSKGGIAERAESFRSGLPKLCRRSEYACLSLPGEVSDLTMMSSYAERLRDGFADIVILGIGGSSLGASALYGIRAPSAATRGRYPQLHFPENLGPHSMSALLEGLDLGATHFMAISKSGATPETLAQLLVCLEAAREELVPDRVRDHFTVIVEPGGNPLRKLARRFQLPIYDHLPELAGRYSVFSIVGLLPVMVAGLDVFAVRNGAREYLESTLAAADPFESAPVAAAAALAWLNREQKVGTTVLMPYDSRLGDFSRWYQQLWGESLGKDGLGTTPIRAMGPVDQHSQLQLYLDGPADKFVTILSERLEGLGAPIDGALAREVGIDYLADRTIGDLVGAEARAVVATLAGHGRPVREMGVDMLDEESLGALMMHFFLETLAMAELMGVNPFDQPAVEEGKRLTREYLGAASDGQMRGDKTKQKR